VDDLAASLATSTPIFLLGIFTCKKGRAGGQAGRQFDFKYLEVS
jgi:hypothetical protein